ncbi:uncharacterized protein P884DRAFT_319421 [Thermothelomyces heterothallicus CBS 202.75]|uniref:uncharacterized protein n=1 Tax=Thermothelomyces heterothallicus CBS 202.75 TaxID=1149848 RepID=UPI0037433ED1
MKCTVTHHSLVGPLPGASIVVGAIASPVSSQGRARQLPLTTRVVLSQGLQLAITHDFHPQPETRLKTTCGATLGPAAVHDSVAGARPAEGLNWVPTGCYLSFDRIDVKFPTESLRWVGLPVRRVPVVLAQAQFANANNRVPRKAGFQSGPVATITISTASSTP